MKRETGLTRRILQSQNGQRIIDFVAPIYNEGETALNCSTAVCFGEMGKDADYIL